MADIQIMTAMNKSVINKITEFKNKEIKKEDLNHFMFINLSYILHNKKKIMDKNNKIKKEQNIEINKTLSKIKTYNGNFVFDSDELESKPIMKKLMNPSLDMYIPLSEISYTTEMKLNKDDHGHKRFNESFLLKNNEQIESENDEKETQFEEAPINFIKFNNECNKFIYGSNYINSINDKFIDLINKSDEDIIEKKKSNDQYNSNLFYELINSFDEGDKEDLDNDCIIDFKQIKSTSFYFDDIFNRKSKQRNSYENYLYFSTASNSTSIGSNSRSFGGMQNENKDIYLSEFSHYMSYEAFKKTMTHMNVDYLRYMLMIYSNSISRSKKFFYMEGTMFLNLMKSFMLKIGISYKKLYEKIIQLLVNNSEKEKENICSFEQFLKGFSQILKLKDENIVLKYKFILSLFRIGEEDINVKHINIFMQLLKGEAVYNVELWDELNRGLVQRYDRIYPNDPDNFRYDKMLICLESFFDKISKR